MVATSFHFNGLFGQSRPFALSKDRRKVWSTNLTLNAIMHRKVIINVTFSIKRSRNFATMGTCITLRLLSIKVTLVEIVPFQASNGGQSNFSTSCIIFAIITIFTITVITILLL